MHLFLCATERIKLQEGHSPGMCPAIAEQVAPLAGVYLGLRHHLVPDTVRLVIPYSLLAILLIQRHKPVLGTLRSSSLLAFHHWSTVGGPTRALDRRCSYLLKGHHNVLHT